MSDFTNVIAREFVDEYLTREIEYIAITEFVDDYGWEEGEPGDEFYRDVAKSVAAYMDVIAQRFDEEE